MKKAEAEVAIRRLSHEWKHEQTPDDLEHPSFSRFKSWLRSKGYGHYLNFRSVMGAEEDAKLWFDQELKQMWRR